VQIQESLTFTVPTKFRGGGGGGCRTCPPYPYCSNTPQTACICR